VQPPLTPQRSTASLIGEFLRLEAAGGIILVIAAVVALVWANTPAASAYFSLLDTPLAVRVGALNIAKPLLLWINDGLMAIFFLLVGLEIKREVLQGELSSARQAALPGIAALGGMIVPALVYVVFNWGNAIALRGWAIPTATDIAFALGVLALLGNRVPASLKIFLLAVAIIDDLAAIIIIAMFYTAELSLLALALAFVGVAALVVLNTLAVTRIAPYILVGVFIWVCVLKSGVHATLAGVAVGLAMPLRIGDATGDAPLERLEHSIHPWVTYGILPIFAFANAGVSLAGIAPSTALGPLPLGIALGLFIGKQVGVLGVSWLAIRLKLASLPDQATWAHLYGVALLTGIGFTMSLFIGTLAFPDPAFGASVRIGVLAGSVASALCAYAVLYRSSRPG